MEKDDSKDISSPNLMEVEEYEERSHSNLMEDNTQAVEEYEERSPPNLMEDNTQEKKEDVNNLRNVHVGNWCPTLKASISKLNVVSLSAR
jgi:hypothetical protein